MRIFLFHNRRLWARRAASGGERRWAEFGGPGEDILLETNPQNRARPQDDVSRASPNSLKLYIIYDILYIIYHILYIIYYILYILYYILYIKYYLLFIIYYILYNIYYNCIYNI